MRSPNAIRRKNAVEAILISVVVEQTFGLRRVSSLLWLLLLHLRSFSSQQSSLGENLSPEALINFFWGAEIDLDAGGFLQLGLEYLHGEQAGPRRRIDQNVQVAIFPILAPHHAPEDARVRHPRLKHKLAERLPMLRQYLGRPHGGFPLPLIPVYR